MARLYCSRLTGVNCHIHDLQPAKHAKSTRASQAACLIFRFSHIPLTGSAFSSRLLDAAAAVSAALAASAAELAAVSSAVVVRAFAPFFAFVAGGAVPSAAFAPHSDAVARLAGVPGLVVVVPSGVPVLVSGTSSPAAAGISDPPWRFRCSMDGPVDWSSATHSDARKSAGFRHSHDLHWRSADGHCDFLAGSPDDCSPGDCCPDDLPPAACCCSQVDCCHCGLPRHDWGCLDRDLAAGYTARLPPRPL